MHLFVAPMDRPGIAANHENARARPFMDALQVLRRFAQNAPHK
jgi:hypothetical protein